MAIFFDQFARFDPLTFEGFGLFQPLVSSLAFDARTILPVDRTSAELHIICARLEAVLSELIPDVASRTAFDSSEWEIIRLAHVHNESLCSGLAFRIHPWEPYSAFALWKLIDACDLEGAGSNDAFDQDAGNSWLAASATLGLASTSMQIASMVCGVTLGGFSSEKLTLRRESASRSEKARISVRGKWKERDMHQAFAMDLLPKLKTKYRIEAARQVLDAIELQFGASYDLETIDRWLKKSNWVSNT